MKIYYKLNKYIDWLHHFLAFLFIALFVSDVERWIGGNSNRSHSTSHLKRAVKKTGHTSMKLPKINLSVTYFSTQWKSASSDQKKSNLKVLLMHMECWGLADYKKNAQTVIFWSEKKDGNILWRVRVKLPTWSLSCAIPCLQK